MNRKPESVSAHKLDLARDLLDDIELSRLPAENLLLKAIRLARLIHDDEISKWLAFELAGYNSSDVVSLKYMEATGRWIDKQKNIGYFQSLPQLDAQIAVNKLQIQQLKVPDIHFAPSSANPNEFVGGFAGSNIQQATAPATSILTQLTNLNSYVTKQSGIRSKVLALLHAFVTRIYYELAFSNLQESIFEKQKKLVDGRLAATCGKVLEKVPAVYDRLSDGDPESVSQALNTCRRIIDAFADAVFPPSDETVNLGGNEVKLGVQNHQNRINAFVHRHCTSDSRRSRIRRVLSDLYERVSSGVHSDVDAEEARFLFLQTYLLIGEVFSLKNAGSEDQSVQVGQSA